MDVDQVGAREARQDRDVRVVHLDTGLMTRRGPAGRTTRGEKRKQKKVPSVFVI
jgi:hypothetical protein